MTILVKFSRDWGDEFNCEELILVEHKSLEEVEAMFIRALQFIKDHHVDLYFGTNEYYDSAELELSDFKFIELDEVGEMEGIEFLKKYVLPQYRTGRYGSFGTGIIYQLLEAEGEYLED